MQLLNRSGDGTFRLPDDGYYQVIPIGEFLHAPTGLTQVIDGRARAAILNSFTADKAKKARVDDTGVLLADYDHFSSDPNQSSAAAGWIEDLQNRADGLYAKIRWTPQGEKEVSGGVYRYISPVWKPDEVESIDNKTIRPLRLDRVGLTNDPNMKGMRPLCNRAEDQPLTSVETRAERLKRIMNSVLNRDTHTNLAEVGSLGCAPGGEGSPALRAYVNRRMNGLTAQEQALMDRDVEGYGNLLSRHGDSDCSTAPLYQPTGEAVEKMFQGAVKNIWTRDWTIRRHGSKPGKTTPMSSITICETRIPAFASASILTAALSAVSISAVSNANRNSILSAKPSSEKAWTSHRARILHGICVVIALDRAKGMKAGSAYRKAKGRWNRSRLARRRERRLSESGIRAIFAIWKKNPTPESFAAKWKSPAHRKISPAQASKFMRRIIAQRISIRELFRRLSAERKISFSSRTLFRALPSAALRRVCHARLKLEKAEREALAVLDAKPKGGA